MKRVLLTLLFFTAFFSFFFFLTGSHSRALAEVQCTPPGACTGYGDPVDRKGDCKWNDCIADEFCDPDPNFPYCLYVCGTCDGEIIYPGWQPDYCDGESGIDTGVGCISMGHAGFATFFFQYLLGIAGVIAFFLILIAGFQILASQGNPEKLQGAKQLLTAAVIGLLFIIFSVVVLGVLKVDIFGGLPGFPEFIH